MQRQGTDDLDGSAGIGDAVLQGILEEDFGSSSVDALVSMAQSGDIDVFGDVMAYLVRQKHPDWAAEICRIVMNDHDRPSMDTKDYSIVGKALAHMITNNALNEAGQVCTFILEIKPDGHGGSFFDCQDLAQVLASMVQSGNASPAGQILYHIYCDCSQQGVMYQVLVPYVLGSLLDQHQLHSGLELSKQLMYADGDRQIDYSVMGWALTQMVHVGRTDWAGQICGGLQAQKLRWYNQGEMFRAVMTAGGPQYSQAINADLMQNNRANIAVDQLSSALSRMGFNGKSPPATPGNARPQGNAAGPRSGSSTPTGAKAGASASTQPAKEESTPAAKSMTVAAKEFVPFTASKEQAAVQAPAEADKPAEGDKADVKDDAEASTVESEKNNSTTVAA